MSELLTYFTAQQQAMVDLLTELIGYETPTKDKNAVDKLGAYMEAQFRALGAESVQRFPMEAVGDMLLAKWHANAPGKPIMFLIHIDTVWPLGTLAERPVTIDAEGKLFGPGAVDMKGGITIVLSAIQGLVARGELPERPIWVLMTSDEEVGSKYSIPLIEEIGQQAGLVLVMEPGTKEGALKTWRRGLAIYKLHVEGRPAHAGNAPEQGINAIVELAHHVLAVNKLNDYKNGTSVSVTMTDGGSAINVIPAAASITIDTRFMTKKVMESIRAQLDSLEPVLPGAQLRLEVLTARGPMEHDDQMKAVFAQTRAIGESYGLTIREDGSGGGSDGNITASMGIATLDGCGAQGDGLHALHEHVVIASLPTRALLMAGILKDWVF